MAVDGDAGREAGKRVDTYGTLRLLTLPESQRVAGPGQARNDFDADPVARQTLALLERGNSAIRFGNLLPLPIADGMLYVQPVYVQSAGETSFPLLQKVLVKFGQDIGFADTLDDALNQVFQGDSGASAGDEDAATGETGAEGADPAETTAQARLQSALNRASAAMEESQEALSTSDFGAYGEAQDKLKSAVADAITAQAEISGVEPDAEEAEPAPAATP
jgi:uncharacterized membrane protein (UPF0182 family)